jgi:hypothetical protein
MFANGHVYADQDIADHFKRFQVFDVQIWGLPRGRNEQDMVAVLAPVSRRYLSGLPAKAFVDSKCNLVDSLGGRKIN